MDDFNKKHPELKEGEVFLINSTIFSFSAEIRWKSKRLGKVAYHFYGGLINDGILKPVFVQRKELEENGVNPDNPRSFGKEFE